MGRFLGSQLRHRRGRVATLGVGILVAALSFTLLTSAAETSELRVLGAVTRYFRPAYDILVRPRGSFSPLERQRGLIQQNYLSGIFGGISFEQYRQIRAIRGVEVAAPIANIGYILPLSKVEVSINQFLSSDPIQLFRLRIEWPANNGLSHYPDSSQYVYYTPRDRFKKLNEYIVGQVLPEGGVITPCLAFNKSKPSGSLSPFQLTGGTGMFCFSARSPELQWPVLDLGPLPKGQVGAVFAGFPPILLAAIDPVEEDKLVGLGQTLVTGRMLRANDRPTVEPGRGPSKPRVVPFIASAKTYVDESIQVTVERLSIPEPPGLYRHLSSETQAYDFVTRQSGRVAGRMELPIGPVYERLLDALSVPSEKLEIPYQAYWTTSRVEYRVVSPDRLEALPTKNPPNIFDIGYWGPGWAATENRDVQFRSMTKYESLSHGRFFPVELTPALQVVGRFDPDKLPGFSRVSQVPLETYYPPVAYPADARSRRLLGGRPLLPTQNVGGYIAQPPLMLTTLQGLKAFVNPQFFEGVNPTAPLSAIRIRVAGVTGPDRLSRERIKNVAQAIYDRTGLPVDITAGSSPHPLLVQLPGGKFGQPPLLVREGWVQKGVAVRFLDALDRKSLALFALILVVCGFFLANGAFASVRSRRQEIGMLLCLGWGQGKIFRAVLGEMALVGAVAGVAGTALAAFLVGVFALQMPVARTLLVVPVAVVLATLAGIVPAWRASRSLPMDAVRPAVSERGGVRRVHRIASMAIGNLLRVPSRTALGAAGLLIGVAALTALVAINRAFQGVLVGTLLGNFVSVRVRGVDLASVVLVIALGGFSVADVLFLNLRERQAEFVTLQTVGWDDRHLRRLVVGEGLAMGAIGSLAGVALGVGLSALIRGIPVSSIVLAAVLAGAAGIFVAAASSLVPLLAIERLTPPTVLAEE